MKITLTIELKQDLSEQEQEDLECALVAQVEDAVHHGSQVQFKVDDEDIGWICIGS